MFAPVRKFQPRAWERVPVASKRRDGRKIWKRVDAKVPPQPDLAKSEPAQPEAESDDGVARKRARAHNYFSNGEECLFCTEAMSVKRRGKIELIKAQSIVYSHEDEVEARVKRATSALAIEAAQGKYDKLNLFPELSYVPRKRDCAGLIRETADKSSPLIREPSPIPVIASRLSRSSVGASSTHASPLIPDEPTPSPDPLLRESDMIGRFFQEMTRRSDNGSHQKIRSCSDPLPSRVGMEMDRAQLVTTTASKDAADAADATIRGRGKRRRSLSPRWMPKKPTKTTSEDSRRESMGTSGTYRRSKVGRVFHLVKTKVGALFRAGEAVASKAKNNSRKQEQAMEPETAGEMQTMLQEAGDLDITGAVERQNDAAPIETAKAADEPKAAFVPESTGQKRAVNKPDTRESAAAELEETDKAVVTEASEATLDQDEAAVYESNDGLVHEAVKGNSETEEAFLPVKKPETLHMFMPLSAETSVMNQAIVSTDMGHGPGPETKQSFVPETAKKIRVKNLAVEVDVARNLDIFAGGLSSPAGTSIATPTKAHSTLSASAAHLVDQQARPIPKRVQNQRTLLWNGFSNSTFEVPDSSSEGAESEDGTKDGEGYQPAGPQDNSLAAEQEVEQTEQPATEQGLHPLSDHYDSDIEMPDWTDEEYEAALEHEHGQVSEKEDDQVCQAAAEQAALVEDPTTREENGFPKVEDSESSSKGTASEEGVYVEETRSGMSLQAPPASDKQVGGEEDSDAEILRKFVTRHEANKTAKAAAAAGAKTGPATSETIAGSIDTERIESSPLSEMDVNSPCLGKKRKRADDDGEASAEDAMAKSHQECSSKRRRCLETELLDTNNPRIELNTGAVGRTTRQQARVLLQPTGKSANAAVKGILAYSAVPASTKRGAAKEDLDDAALLRKNTRANKATAVRPRKRLQQLTPDERGEQQMAEDDRDKGRLPMGKTVRWAEDLVEYDDDEVADANHDYAADADYRHNDSAHVEYNNVAAATTTITTTPSVVVTKTAASNRPVHKTRAPKLPGVATPKKKGEMSAKAGVRKKSSAAAKAAAAAAASRRAKLVATLGSGAGTPVPRRVTRSWSVSVASDF